MRITSLLVGTVTGLALVLTPLAASAATVPAPAGESRLQGSDRYETSAAISRQTFSGPLESIYIASGANFADALAGGPAAAQAGAPILLTRPDRIPDSIKTELARLEPATIYVLGGPSALNAEVEEQLGEYADSVVRLSGADRYSTAAAISKHGWDTTADTVFIASGGGFADGVSGGAAAAQTDAPLLITGRSSLAAATKAELSRLDPQQVYLLGGPAALSADAETQIRAAAPGARVTRLSGDDRYETSTAVAEALWPGGASAMFFATGLDFADALSGTPATHVNDAPVVLTRTTCMPTPVALLKADFAPSATVVLGGRSSIANQAINSECGTARYSGSGDSVIDITKPGGAHQPAIAAIDHTGSSNFAVWTLDSNMDRIDLLVNEIGDYSGRVLFDERDYQRTVSMEITADGPWEVVVTPVSTAKGFSGNSATGTGDEVLVWNGRASSATLTHDGASNFAIWVYPDDWPDLLVNEIGSYRGTVRWPAGPSLIDISADGPWSITVN